MYVVCGRCVLCTKTQLLLAPLTAWLYAGTKGDTGAYTRHTRHERAIRLCPKTKHLPQSSTAAQLEEHEKLFRKERTVYSPALERTCGVTVSILNSHDVAVKD